jgi:hypothetical protein
MVRLFVDTPLSTPSLSGHHSHVINALLNFPMHSLVHLWFPENDYRLLDKLMAVFEDTFQFLMPEGDEPTDDEVFGSPVDEVCLPLILVLKKVAENPDCQKKMREQWLPANINRKQALTKGKSITACLIRSMSSIRFMQTRDLLCEMLLSLFNNDSWIF